MNVLILINLKVNINFLKKYIFGNIHSFWNNKCLLFNGSRCMHDLGQSQCHIMDNFVKVCQQFKLKTQIIVNQTNTIAMLKIQNIIFKITFVVNLLVYQNMQ